MERTRWQDEEDGGGKNGVEPFEIHENFRLQKPKSGSMTFDLAMATICLACSGVLLWWIIYRYIYVVGPAADSGFWVTLVFQAGTAEVALVLLWPKEWGEICYYPVGLTGACVVGIIVAGLSGKTNMIPSILALAVIFAVMAASCLFWGKSDVR